MSRVKANEKSKTRKPKASHTVQAGSNQANRIAIAVLEVLAGARTPSDAAQALGVSVARYYQLETRAVSGLVTACEPPPRGKQPSLKTAVAALERQLEAAHRETARQQALVRAAHRSLGLKAAPAKSNPGKKKGAVRRAKRPSVRAMKVVKALQENDRVAAAAEVQPTAADTVAPGEHAGGETK